MTDYFFDPVADVFTPIAAVLEAATGNKSYLLEKSKNHALVRWDWTPTTGACGVGPQNPGSFPVRVLDSTEFRCDIACRGKTFGAAWQMLQQLLTASRVVKAAAGKAESWRVEESSDQASTLKSVVILTMVWKMPLLEQTTIVGTEPVTIKHVALDTSSPDYGTNNGTLIAPLG